MKKWPLFMLLAISFMAQGQTGVDTLDVNEVMKKVMGKSQDKPASGISILPAIGYNPSIGFMIGGTLTGGKTLGPPATTRMSTAAATAFITTKGVINLQLRHNVFTSENHWNFQGNAQITRMVLLDYGLGPSSGKGSRESMSISQYTLKNAPTVYPLSFNYIRFFEKAYKKVSPSIMVGAGVGIDYHFGIRDERLDLDSGKLTPHYKYSTENGFNPKHYWTNGFLLNVQYNTREHPNRSHGGSYADLSIRVNPKFIGSTRGSTQLMTEYRKYFSLSKANPEHVIAFWHLGTFNLAGKIPYLDMPGTATDMYNRSGRAYTIGRFRGPSFFYLESEYRFPITRNKFISGVAFTNIESVSDGKTKGLFTGWDPGIGAGLRILFNRATRTNICIDYAVGRYGAKGLFFGLNEVF
jgi:hypothetical protein